MAAIDILLATFDGERHLAVQLDSLLAQEERDLRILVRDDGSRDRTGEILNDYATRHPGLIEVVPADGVNRRAAGNFAELLRLSSAPLVMFCDQDDLWHPDKVSSTRAAMRQLEDSSPVGSALLVGSDLRVVDQELHELAPSFAAFQRLPLGAARDFRRALVQNTIAGCAMMLNRRLVDLLLPIPPEAVLHDHWAVLVASALGRIAVIERPLADYRQHGGNQVGAAGMDARGIATRVQAGGGGGYRAKVARLWPQADALLVRHGDRLEPGHRAACAAAAGIPARGWFGRRSTIMRHGLWKSGLVRNLALLAVV